MTDKIKIKTLCVIFIKVIAIMLVSSFVSLVFLFYTQHESGFLENLLTIIEILIFV